MKKEMKKQMTVEIKGRKINIFLLVGGVLLLIFLALTTILGSYMAVRKIGQLKNNSLSTKLDAYKIENDFWNFGDKFDDEYNNILFCGVDNFNNTDVIMVISINKKQHKIKVLRIPRDTYIGDHYKTGKINAVHSQPKPNLTGADTLAYEINNIFRIKIDKYIFMTLDIFEEMIDDIGGVDIVLERDIPVDKSNVIKKGKVHLDGQLGADFVRHRKSYIMGDIGRIHAQEQFVKELGKKLIKDKYLSNLPFLNKFYNLIETNIGRKEVNQYTKALKNVDVEDIKTFVFSGEGLTHNRYSVYLLDVAEVVSILNEHFMPEGTSVRESDIKLVKYLKPDPITTSQSLEFSQESREITDCDIIYEDDIVNREENLDNYDYNYEFDYNSHYNFDDYNNFDSYDIKEY